MPTKERERHLIYAPANERTTRKSKQKLSANLEVIRNMLVDKKEDVALALLLNLSDNCLKQSQINAVFYQIDKNGLGGS